MRSPLLALLSTASLASAALAAPAAGPWCPDPTVQDPTVVALEPTGPAVGGRGSVELRMAGSPYGVTVSSDGRYVTDVRVTLEGLRPYEDRRYVVWATTADLDDTVKLGVVDSADGRVRGTLGWNQFLVFVTIERDPTVERWAGPIVFTAMSPSGKMHTKAGHGVFESYSYLC